MNTGEKQRMKMKSENTHCVAMSLRVVLDREAD